MSVHHIHTRTLTHTHVLTLLLQQAAGPATMRCVFFGERKEIDRGGNQKKKKTGRFFSDSALPAPRRPDSRTLSSPPQDAPSSTSDQQAGLDGLPQVRAGRGGWRERDCAA